MSNIEHRGEYLNAYITHRGKVERVRTIIVEEVYPAIGEELLMAISERIVRAIT